MWWCNLFSKVFSEVTTRDNYQHPEAAVALKEKTIEATIGMMEGFNAPPEVVAETLDKMEAQPNQYSISSQIQSSAIFLVIQAVIGLIVALILKRKED